MSLCMLWLEKQCDLLAFPQSLKQFTLGYP